jgi:hypothetical protein
MMYTKSGADEGHGDVGISDNSKFVHTQWVDQGFVGFVRWFMRVLFPPHSKRSTFRHTHTRKFHSPFVLVIQGQW